MDIIPESDWENMKEIGRTLLCAVNRHSPRDIYWGMFEPKHTGICRRCGKYIKYDKAGDVWREAA